MTGRENQPEDTDVPDTGGANGPESDTGSTDDRTAGGLTPDEIDPRSSKSVVRALSAGLTADDPETRERAGIALCLVANAQPGKTSAIIGDLVERVVTAPDTDAVVRTLGTLAGNHGREIRGALMTETGYSNARKLYGRIEHADPWALSEIEIEESDTESFYSAVMRLVEIGERDREALDPDAWTRFIERLLGEGGTQADDNELRAAADRQGGRPRTVRKRAERIEAIEQSRLFRSIEARSRFDELTVLSPTQSRRLARTIRARGRIGAEEYAVTIRLLRDVDEPAFRAQLARPLAAWGQFDDAALVRLLDWGESPRPWLATEPVERTLADHGRLSAAETVEHARTLTDALLTLHRAGVVHGGIDPLAVGYPPNTLDGAVEPMLDDVGLIPVYRQYVDPKQYFDCRYGAPEWFGEQDCRIDHRTDIYQLGLVLYRALTGTAPRESPETADRSSAAETACAIPDGIAVPDGLPAVLRKATATQKLMRYENALRFHQDVRAIQKH